MKTTFDLPESLVGEIKRIAKSRGTTARAVVQEALVRVVEEDAPAEPFVLRDMSVAGLGADLDPDILNSLVLESYDR